jgi:hypothetical protein
MIWDPTNKKWTVSIGAAAAIDLEQNIIMAAGSAATPSLRRAGDLDTGLYFPAADEVALAAGGKVAFHVKEAGTQMNYYFNSEDATSQLQIDVLDSNYTYIHHDSSASNSHLYFRNTTAGGHIRLGAGGTDRWAILAGGDLIPVVDASYNIGDTTYGLKRIFNGNGSAAVPSITFKNDSNTGFFRDASDEVKISRGGTDRGALLDSYYVFHAYRTATKAMSAGWNTLTGYTGELVDRGSRFNTTTGTFTAPVAGQYLLTGWCFNPVNINLYIRFNKNSGSYVAYGGISPQYGGTGASMVLDLNASDTVVMQIYCSAASFGPWQFSGKLLGED